MKFSVNIDMLFKGMDYAEGITKAGTLGFRTAEILFVKEKNIEKLEKACQKSGVRVELLLADFIDLTDAAKHDELIQAAEETIEIGKHLGCRKLLFVSGDDIRGLSREQQLENIKQALIRMIPILEKNDWEALLEPVNDRIDHPGTFLTRSDDAFRIVKSIGNPRIKVLYDIYHMQIMEGDVTRRILNHLEWIGHLHLAGNPGRNEISCGELDLYRIMELLEQNGYTGYFGLEYTPLNMVERELEKVLRFWKQHGYFQEVKA